MLSTFISENDKPCKYTARDSSEEAVKERAQCPYENGRQYERLYDTGRELCEYVNQDENLTEPRWLTRPLVMLAFDESQFLMDLTQGHDRTATLFADMDHVLHKITNLPIFSLFISRAGRFYEPPPKTEPHPLLMRRRPPLTPITEIGFDDLAYSAMENTVTLERVVQSDWIAHLGRPVYICFTSCFGELLTSLLEQVWCLL